jgi:two-component system response regulator RegX3
MTRILLVEDETALAEAVAYQLIREGFDVDTSSDGIDALERFGRTRPDLVLLDLMLPRLSGQDVCREIRRRSHVPIIMLTARAEEVDRVIGLELGADDYIGKPFGIRELLARIKAVLRRTERGPENELLRIGDVELIAGSFQVTVRGRQLQLPRKEFELLELLMNSAGRVLTREYLIEEVWGSDYVGDTRTLDVHIKRLRAKCETDPSRPRHLVTVRGVGYRFELD